MAKSTKKTTTKTVKKAGAADKAAAANEVASKKVTTKKAAATKSEPAKKATAAKKVPKSPFGKRFVESQRLLLLSERAKYVTSADTLKAEADALVESREPGDVQFDEESGEGDTLAVERERDLALSAHARAAVDMIDAALIRVEKGVYGVCMISGDPIPKERLEVIPWAAERVEHKAGGLGRR